MRNTEIDYYEILGVTKDATEAQIKKAYRKLALTTHPDQGGDPEQFKTLSEAYNTLVDTQKRALYDAQRSALLEEAIEISGNLPPGNTPPYSLKFRQEHQKLAAKFEAKGLEQFLEVKDEPFKSNIYHIEEKRGGATSYHDIFTLIRDKKSPIKECKTTPFQSPLDPKKAIQIFIEFLSGLYDDENIKLLIAYFPREIKRTKDEIELAPEIQLYEAIHEIVCLVKAGSIKSEQLIVSLIKITNYAKIASLPVLPAILPLFYNKYYRNLCAYSVHLFLNRSKDETFTERFSQFDGRKLAEDFLDLLKIRMSNNRNNQSSIAALRQAKLFLNFEEDLHDQTTSNDTAENYREKAFHLLDWMPVLREIGGRDVLANIFIQIGMNFQQASRLMSSPAIQMADERLALSMYHTAIELGRYETPDMEMYVNIHVLKSVSSFQYHDEMLDELIQALKKRTFILMDVFPLFQTPQSNIAFINHESRMLYIMRHLLQAMIMIHAHNQVKKEKIPIDHSPVTILYQAYEASLKNWYQENYDPEIEHIFRSELMRELLAEKGWSHEHVEKNLLSPWVMVQRSPEGWIKPSASCLPQQTKFEVFRSIHGAEINFNTGNIVLFLEPWSNQYPIYEQNFSIFDIQEMLEKNIGAAFFSLDPVDPDKRYHPFNTMRYGPSQLFETELLNTMLLTDYLLKFLTTHQEVQGQYPFDQRPIDLMIQQIPNFPEHLRKIIEDFHNAQHSEEIHRFWIEAEEIKVFSDEKEQQKQDGVTRVALGELKMIVKKHRMILDDHGNLKDVGNEDEGWPIYILTPAQMCELEQRQRMINGRAMIFIYTREEIKLFYWKNNEVIAGHIPQNYRESLIRLYKKPREPDGKIILNTENSSLLYRVTRDMSLQSGQLHHYSHEFIFAHEFTTHYDEFSKYLPEFGRLKELSRITVVIRILNSIRLSNQETINALDCVLGSSPPSMTSNNSEVYNYYKKAHQENITNTCTFFQEMRSDFSSSILRRKHYDKLMSIRNEIGTFVFNDYSVEVNEQCQRLYGELEKINSGISSERIWREVINPKRSEFARMLSDSKKKAWRAELYQNFSDSLLSSLGASSYSRLIDTFIAGDINPLVEALVRRDKTQVLQQTAKKYPSSPVQDVASALDDDGERVAVRIANEKSRRQLIALKGLKTKLESGFLEINFGKREEKVDLSRECLWVPASVRHSVRKDSTTGQTRYSFFVYGGVNLQARTTYLYQVVNADGSHGKFGITVNPATRYSARELAGGQLHVLTQGSRKQMLQSERFMHEIVEPGNREGVRAHRQYAARQAGWQNIYGGK